MPVTVEELYKHFAVLADAKDKAGEHEDAYLAIMEGVKGTSSEKRLASQFIARFFKFFPTSAEQALNCQFDLCEDDDLQIRKQAIKDLPMFCRGMPEHIPRISDVLTQLLQTDDPAEMSLVHTSLASLLRSNTKEALGGLFSQILQGEDMVREKAIKFLQLKLPLLDEEQLTKEVEDYLIAEIRKVLQDVTGDEFIAFMKILSSLKSMATMLGRKQIVEIVADQADLDKEFQASDPDSADRLIQCIRQVTPLFSRNVHSTKFFLYVVDHVIPVLSELTDSEDDGQVIAAQVVQLDLLKLVAEMSEHSGEFEEKEERALKIYNALTTLMPLPPAGENEENSDTTTTAAAAVAATPTVQFSHVECLMYTFHQIARKCPEILAAEENAERLKDFRLRLQFLARGVQVYIKQLRMALQGKTGEALKSDENKIKVVALRTTNNINVLIKDLFHNPPSYKAAVNLSWKPLLSEQKSPEATKRPGYTPIKFPEGQGPKKAKSVNKGEDVKMYAPPSGKFSDKAGKFTGMYSDREFSGQNNTTTGRGRGRGRGRGGFRGRQYFKRY